MCSQGQQSIAFSLYILKVNFLLVRGSWLTSLETEVLNTAGKQGQNGYNMSFSSALVFCWASNLGWIKERLNMRKIFLSCPHAKRLAHRKLVVLMGDTEVWFQPVVLSAEASMTRINSYTFFFQIIKPLANNSDPAVRNSALFLCSYKTERAHCFCRSSLAHQAPRLRNPSREDHLLRTTARTKG